MTHSILSIAKMGDPKKMNATTGGWNGKSGGFKIPESHHPMWKAKFDTSRFDKCVILEMLEFYKDHKHAIKTYDAMRKAWRNR